MLLELDPEIEALPIQAGGKTAEVAALENLAIARREGKHLVVGRGTSLRSLANWGRLSDQCRATLRQAASRSTEEMGLAGELAIRVVVKSSASGSSVAGSEGQRVVTVPLRFFSDSRSVQPSRILGESLGDADLYITLGEYFGRESGRQGLLVALEPVGGGGSATASVYEREQRASAGFCICIVDSDRDYPCDEVGDTAREVLDRDDSAKPYCAVYIPNVRTAENLLPHRILEAIAYSNIRNKSGPIPERQEIARRIQKLAEGDEPEVRLWMPLKLQEPVRFESILKLATREDSKAYWGGWAVDVGRCCEVAGICRVPSRCCRSGGCTCEVLPTAKGMLKTGVEFLQELSPQKLSEVVTSDEVVRAEWMRIGRLTFSWGCSKRASIT